MAENIRNWLHSNRLIGGSFQTYLQTTNEQLSIKNLSIGIYAKSHYSLETCLKYHSNRFLEAAIEMKDITQGCIVEFGYKGMNWPQIFLLYMVAKCARITGRLPEELQKMLQTIDIPTSRQPKFDLAMQLMVEQCFQHQIPTCVDLFYIYTSVFTTMLKLLQNKKWVDSKEANDFLEALYDSPDIYECQNQFSENHFLSQGE